MKKNLLIFILPYLFIACASNEPEIKFNKPKINMPQKKIIVQNKKGSLYSMEGASLFADKKDLQIGDIIQINITEQVDQSSKNKRELTSDRLNNLGGGVISPTSNNDLSGAVSSAANKLNGVFGMGFGTKSKTDDSGEVKTNFNEDFATRISAVIEQTYQNGNYFIKGIKEILIDGQKQTIIVSGMIRPYDITPDNTVESSQIANLKIMYDKEGEEADVLNAPWGLKLLRSIWPF